MNAREKIETLVDTAAKLASSSDRVVLVSLEATPAELLTRLVNEHGYDTRTRSIRIVKPTPDDTLQSLMERVGEAEWVLMQMPAKLAIQDQVEG